jgi:6-phosphogluconolactonase (cycloisomerase 2 family)
MYRRSALAVLTTLALVACSDNEVTTPDSALSPAFSAGNGRAGAVYAMTNSATENEVLVYRRSANGTLGEPIAYATGGTGTGAGLGSQGALVLTSDGDWLLAVNAGSNELSVFQVGGGGLTLTDRISSGGDMPIGVTAYGSLVYVVNAGGAGNISGFWLSPDGDLSAIDDSTRPLSGAGTGPAQVEFTPAGDQLVVTEKGTNLILTYDVDSDGQTSGPATHASAGTTPFGFAFARGDLLIVSEAFGGAPDASATSSYRLAGTGLELVSGSVGTTETAACWTVVTNNGKFAYVTNTGSGSVTGYRVANDGTLTLLDDDGVTGSTGPGSTPIDAAFSGNSRFLYVLTAGNGGISAFSVAKDGSLTSIDAVSGLPSGSVGIAAR